MTINIAFNSKKMRNAFKLVNIFSIYLLLIPLSISNGTQLNRCSLSTDSKQIIISNLIPELDGTKITYLDKESSSHKMKVSIFIHV